MVTVENPTRVFKSGSKTYEDPNPALTPDEVLDYLCNTDAQLVNSVIKQPKFDEEKNELVFELTSNFKSKG